MGPFPVWSDYRNLGRPTEAAVGHWQPPTRTTTVDGLRFGRDILHPDAYEVSISKSLTPVREPFFERSGREGREWSGDTGK